MIETKELEEVSARCQTEKGGAKGGGRRKEGRKELNNSPQKKAACPSKSRDAWVKRRTWPAAKTSTQRIKVLRVESRQPRAREGPKKRETKAGGGRGGRLFLDGWTVDFSLLGAKGVWDAITRLRVKGEEGLRRAKGRGWWLKDGLKA